MESKLDLSDILSTSAKKEAIETTVRELRTMCQPFPSKMLEMIKTLYLDCFDQIIQEKEEMETNAMITKMMCEHPQMTGGEIRELCRKKKEEEVI